MSASRSSVAIRGRPPDSAGSPATRGAQTAARIHAQGECGRAAGSELVSDPSHLRLRDAVERLRPLDREILRLVAWDGLQEWDFAYLPPTPANLALLRVPIPRGYPRSNPVRY
jgi:hypothetical protein